MHDFPVALKPLLFNDEEDFNVENFINIPERRVIVRTDTNQVLGIASPNYKIITHKSVVDKFDGLDFLKRDRITTAQNGALMLADYDIKNKKEFQVKKGDIVKMQLRLFNSYNFSCGVGFELRALRLVCTNGLMIPKAVGRFSYRHFENAPVEQLATLIDNVYDNSCDILNLWKTWSNAEVDNHKRQLWFDETNEILKKKTAERLTVLALDASTVWDMFNIYTKYISHELKTRKEDMLPIKQQKYEREIIPMFYKIFGTN